MSGTGRQSAHQHLDQISYQCGRVTSLRRKDQSLSCKLQITILKLQHHNYAEAERGLNEEACLRLLQQACDQSRWWLATHR